jgi:hypothetical protein
MASLLVGLGWLLNVEELIVEVLEVLVVVDHALLAVGGGGGWLGLRVNGALGLGQALAGGSLDLLLGEFEDV